MPERVRVGIIGTSWWADSMHLPGLKSHPRAELGAICGRNRERAEEMAKKYDIPGVFTDYREMIEKADLQALVVSVPDDLHHPVTIEALDAGLHVLCEKPLALNAGQAGEMYEKAESAGVKHMVLFTYRWMPHYRYLKELIDEGYIGRCFHVHFHYLAGSNRNANRYKWRYDRGRANGVLGDLGSHIIDMVQWCVGDIVKVNAHLAVFSELPGPEGQTLDPATDSAMLNVTFQNGAQGSLHASNVALIGDKRQAHYLALHGDSGALEGDFALGTGTEIRGARADGNEFKPLSIPDHIFGDVDRTQPFMSQIQQIFTTRPVGDRLFIDAILKDRPLSPNFYDGLKVQKVIDAAAESHQNGHWISVS